MQYEILNTGDGQVTPKSSDTVTVHYHGMLIDGTVFDSSVDKGESITFGVNQVIKGWTEALQLMRVGDKWRLTIPPELAYGESRRGPIGPGLTVIYELELLKIN